MERHQQAVEGQTAGMGVRAWPRAVGVLVAFACVLLPGVAVAAPNETRVSSRSSGEGPPDAVHSDPSETCPICFAKQGGTAISADGRFVAFGSNAPNLVPGDVNSRGDAFLRDHGAVPPTTMLISRESDAMGVPGAVGDAGSVPTSISADGRFVVFTSAASNLAVGDRTLTPDVFVRDRDADGDQIFDENNATTTLVSARPNGIPDGQSSAGAISADGRYVAFVSSSSGLVTGVTDANGEPDVFVRDRDPDGNRVFEESNATTTLVSRGGDDGPPAGVAQGTRPSISADGRYVVFNGGTKLVAGRSGGIFVRDVEAKTTSFVAPGEAATSPSVSGDGRLVAFMGGGNVMAGVDRGLFVADRQQDTVTLVSPARSGVQCSGRGDGCEGPEKPSISRNGQWVAFVASDRLVADDKSDLPDVYVRDLRDGTTVLASRSTGQGVAGTAAGLPADGEPGNLESHTPAMADGPFVAFASRSSNLVTPDGNLITDIFRRELAPPTPPSGARDCTVGGAVDACPALSVDDRSVVEGGAGAQVDATFTVSLSARSPRPVTVDFVTADDSAVAPGDYVARTVAVTFAPGEEKKAVTVKVNGDALLEQPDERFLVNLANAGQATIADRQGVGTILDEDEPAASAAGSWAKTSAAPQQVGGYAAALLSGPDCRDGSPEPYCGKLLVTADQTTVQLYDPRSDSWSGCAAGQPNCGSADRPGNLNVARIEPTLTLLDGRECRAATPPGYCGKVLVVGGTQQADGERPPPGDPRARVELYDPATGRWSSCDSPASASAACPAPYPEGAVKDHTATSLSDGRVLIAGGQSRVERVFYVYSPALGQWGSSGTLANRRRDSRAVLLEGSSDQCASHCGKVLLVGGDGSFDGQTPLTAELVDPVAGGSVPTPPLITARAGGHSGTSLRDGRVLVAGGGAFGQHAEYFDPKAGPLGAWSQARPLRVGGDGHTATLLGTGRLLLAGGRESGVPAELYDPAGPVRAADWFAGHGPISRGGTATLLASGPLSVCATNCGKVLVTETSGSPRFAWLYTPAPRLATIGPASGPAAGDTQVTLEGSGLASVTSVHFGAARATSLTRDPQSPDTKLIATSPSHTAGTTSVVPVTVTSSGGTSPGTQRTQFTYTGVTTSGGGETASGGGETATGGTTSSAFMPGTGGAQQSGAAAPSGGGSAAAGPGGTAGTLAQRASRARALRSCLARVERHATRERRAAQRAPARRRALARRHLARHRASARRSCMARHAVKPGRVRGLVARATSGTKVVLSFLATGTDALRPPAARSYVVKQSLRPIRGAQGFRRAQTLCAGVCRLDPQRVGERLELTVTDLRPHTTYYYAIAARDDATRRLGPPSLAVRVRTR